MKKVLLLFSGGLDSILSYYILKENNFNIKVVQFYTPFLNISDKNKHIQSIKKKYNISLNIISIWESYIDILINPQFGYGENLNPCLDCKLLFYKKAKEIMIKENFDFIATGEVAGQRPFSQRSDALNFLEKKSELKGRILRPLSASFSANIDNIKLYNIKGRGRKKQLELAKKFNIVPIPTPAGGCLLTEPSFCSKIKLLIDFFEKKDLKEVLFEIIKYGRVFKIENSIVVIARDKYDGEQLLRFAKDNSLPLIIPDNYPGPVSIFFYKDKLNIELIISKIKTFVKKDYIEKINFKIENLNETISC